MYLIIFISIHSSKLLPVLQDSPQRYRRIERRRAAVPGTRAPACAGAAGAGVVGAARGRRRVRARHLVAAGAVARPGRQPRREDLWG